jgi:hypothetical protein
MYIQAIQDVAGMKAFELRPVLNVLNTFTASVRESVLQIFQVRARSVDEMCDCTVLSGVCCVIVRTSISWHVVGCETSVRVACAARCCNKSTGVLQVSVAGSNLPVGLVDSCSEVS